jgi:hypothetical protein
MYNAIISFFLTKGKMTKHLLNKQREINKLRKRIEELEKEQRVMVERVRVAHKTLEEAFSDYCLW